MPKIIVNDTIREMTAEEIANVNAIAEKSYTVTDGLIVNGADGKVYRVSVDESGKLIHTEL